MGKGFLTQSGTCFGLSLIGTDMDGDAFLMSLEQSNELIIAIAGNDAPSEPDKKGHEQKKPAQNMARRIRKHGEAVFYLHNDPRYGTNQ